jgi:hypothetical protein
MMTNTPVEVDSILALDIGAVNTRALLFDVSDGTYRFIAAGKAPTTITPPFRDVSECVRLAVEDLQEITGRILIGDQGQIIYPGKADGSGVGKVVATLSAGPALKIIAVGLLPEVSIDSAQHLISTTYAKISEVIGLNDRRKPVVQIDSILKINPDLIVFSGGVDNGASHSLLKLAEVVRLACSIQTENNRPEILYAGNQQLAGEIKTIFESLTPVHIAPNIRPSIDIENISPAQNILSKIFIKSLEKQIGGFHDLKIITGEHIETSATAFGRIIRFISQTNDTKKSVLGIDLGATSTTLAAATSGNLHLSVQTPLGIGEGLNGLIQTTSISEIARWLTIPISDDSIRDYVFNKLLYPANIPNTIEALSIEQAIARQIMRLAISQSSRQLSIRSDGQSILTNFEPIIALGSIFSSAPTFGQCALMILDGLQPTGITTLIVDQNGLIPSLGAIAPVNNILPVQVMGSGAFINLGTVVTPVSNTKSGTPILLIRLLDDRNNEKRFEIKKGELIILPLPYNQPAKMYLQPYHQTDIGMGRAGRGGSVKITGGMLGVIIDARGRPLTLPDDMGRRQELIKKWLWALEKQE